MAAFLSFVSAILHPLLERLDRVVVIKFPISTCDSTCSRNFHKVTPLIDVRLQDVLDRKHLPPLGSRFICPDALH